MAERQQVNSLGRPEGLRPQASPVDTTVAPVAPSETNPALLLAQTLSSINPTLQRSLEAERDRQMERQAAIAERRLAGLTFEEAEELVNSGQLHEYANPYFRAAFDRIQGSLAARGAFEDIQHRVAAGEINLIDEDLSDLLAPFVSDERFAGRSAHFQGGFSEAFGTYENTLLEAQNQARVGQTSMELENSVLGTFRTAVDAALENGTAADAQEAVRLIQVSFADRNDGNPINLSYQQTDDMIFRLARVYAERGQEDVVEALLFTARTGADGSSIPSIASKAQYALDSETLLNQARAQRTEADIEAELNLRMSVMRQIEGGDYPTDAELQSLPLSADARMSLRSYRESQRGSRSTEARVMLEQAYEDQVRSQVIQSLLPSSENGGLPTALLAGELWDGFEFDQFVDGVRIQVNMGLPEIQEGVRQAWWEHIDNRVASLPADVQEPTRLAMQIDWISRNNVENPEWTLMFDNVGTVSLESLSDPNNIPVSYVQALNTYRRMPESIRRAHITDEETYRFLNAANTLMIYNGQTPESAMATAAARMQDPNYGEQLVRLRTDVSRRLSDRIGRVEGFPEIENAGFLRPLQLDLISQIMADTGVNANRALARANEIITDRFINVGGRMMFVPRGQDADLLRQGARRFLRDFSENNELMPTQEQLDWARSRIEMQSREPSGGYWGGGYNLTPTEIDEEEVYGRATNLSLIWNPGTNTYTIFEGDLPVMRENTQGFLVPQVVTQAELIRPVLEDEARRAAEMREQEEARAAENARRAARRTEAAGAIEGWREETDADPVWTLQPRPGVDNQTE